MSPEPFSLAETAESALSDTELEAHIADCGKRLIACMEAWGQGGNFAGVAAIKWREGGDLGDCLGGVGIAHPAILGAGLTRHVYASQIN